MNSLEQICKDKQLDIVELITRYLEHSPDLLEKIVQEHFNRILSIIEDKHMDDIEDFILVCIE